MAAEDQLSRLISELCSRLMAILDRGSDLHPAGAPPVPRRSLPQRMTPAGFAWLLLGASLTLMLCGSVAFFIGFMLMPWVIGLVVVLYFAWILSSLSARGRALFFRNRSPSVPKETSGSLRSNLSSS